MITTEDDISNKIMTSLITELQKPENSRPIILNTIKDQEIRIELLKILKETLQSVISDKSQSKDLLINYVFPIIKTTFEEGTPLFKEVFSEYSNEIGMIFQISRIILILNLVFLLVKLIFWIYKRFK